MSVPWDDSVMPLRSWSSADLANVFPDPLGRMLSRHTPLEEVLRRALKHAGIVEGWQHVFASRAATTFQAGSLAGNSAGHGTQPIVPCRHGQGGVRNGVALLGLRAVGQDAVSAPAGARREAARMVVAAASRRA